MDYLSFLLQHGSAAGTGTAIFTIAGAILGSRPRTYLAPGAPLAELLAADEMVVYRGGRIVFSGGGRSCEAAVLGVQALPDAFSESLSLEIMRAPCELTVVHTLRPHERASEIMTMQRQAKVAGDMSIGDGLGQREQIEMANAIVQGTHPSGLSSNVWTYNLTVVVYAESKAKLKAALLPVERALTLAGATATREGLAAEAAWWSVLPTFPEIHRRWRFLTDAELDFVLGRSHRSYAHAALIKRYKGGQSAIVDTSLNPLGDLARTYSSGRAPVLKLRKLIGEHGSREGLQSFLHPSS